ncbi:DUF4179 domain-containing protein [Neobacillus niacini]|uniref:DUF4179 domain-containing protein n=1 Tax=Neobacillus niacini TaxID=86668 RepID=UPI002862227C|nr:DUF4179 domain-containing protein [Neobacillus niacini]MDR6999033.1 hypothetical protein [Neobacillus niacini]
MKKLYKFFNSVNLSDKDMVEVPIEQPEIETTKNRVLISINKQKDKHSRILVILATSAIVLLSFSILSYVKPTNASKIPILGNLFSFFQSPETKVLDSYHENATTLNLSVESNSKKINLNEAVYDGDMLTISFNLKTKENLGDYITGNPVKINGVIISKDTTLLLKKMDKTDYAGLVFVTVPHELQKETLNVDWSLKELFNPYNEVQSNGKWFFNFSINKISSQKFSINEIKNKFPLIINVKYLEKTPISMKLKYSIKLSDTSFKQPNIGFEITDDLGNKYSSFSNSISLEDDNTYDINEIYSKLNEKAKKLYFKPVASVYDKNGKLNWIKINSFQLDLK